MTQTLATFKRRNQVPPGGAWFFVDKDTGSYFESRDSFLDLLGKIGVFYQANGRQVPENLRDMVEDYICRNSPAGFCDNQSESKPRLDFFSVLQYTEVLFNKMKARVLGREFLVPLSEAERRARICIGCPSNHRHICGTCSGLRDVAAKLVANHATKYDGWLGACGVCGCALASKIHVKKEYLATSEEQLAEVPDNCWMKDSEGSHGQ